MAEDAGFAFPKLSETNYQSWADSMEARLRRNALWRIVTGEKKAPAATDLDATELHLERVDRAAGEILGMVSEGQRTAVKAVRHVLG